MKFVVHDHVRVIRGYFPSQEVHWCFSLPECRSDQAPGAGAKLHFDAGIDKLDLGHLGGDFVGCVSAGGVSECGLESIRITRFR